MDGDPVSGSITANSTRVIDCYNSGEFGSILRVPFAIFRFSL